jgi:hypothetical protein
VCSVVLVSAQTEKRYSLNHPDLDMNEHDILTEREVASEMFCGLISVKTLQLWRRQGRGPNFTKLGRRVCYLRSDIVDYLQRSRVETEVPPVLPPASEAK